MNRTYRIYEIAYLKGYITTEKLLKTAEELKKTDYGQYLFNLAREDWLWENSNSQKQASRTCL